MEVPVEIRYAGVVIGRTQEVRSADGDSSSLFLVVREPMPVGSVLRLRSGDRETPVRVVHAVESSDPAGCGMQVCPIGEADQVATEWIPPPAAAPEKARPAEQPAPTAMPVIEVVPPRIDPPPSTFEPVAPIAAEPAMPVPVEPEAPVAAEVAPAASSDEVSAWSDEPIITIERAAPAPARESEAPSATAVVPPAAVPEATRAAAPGDAVPEAVPVAVGSSMTGALENAAEGASADTNQETAASPDGEPAEQGSQDLPPARPIAGPSGRRKTKRRR